MHSLAFSLINLTYPSQHDLNNAYMLKVKNASSGLGKKKKKSDQILGHSDGNKTVLHFAKNGLSYSGDLGICSTRT